MTRTSHLTEHTIKVLLIDDQAMIGEAVRRMLAEECDIQFHYCSDPNKAIEVAEEIEPTLILQDLVMPDIDGLTLVKTFRASPKLEMVPLIVLSSKEDASTKAEAFALGANDYIVKLPDKIELIARIRHHSGGYINLLQRNEAFEKLESSQKELAAELAEAAQYVSGLLPAPLTEDPIRTDWRFETSTSLGGDAFGYHWIDDDRFALYLLDVCGHGVGAALLSVSVMNTISSATLPDVDFADPANVLNALNKAFPMEKHNIMYFTMWYGVWHKSTRKLVYSSGGHPPSIMLSGDPTSPQIDQLRTPAMPVGAIGISKYEAAEIEVPPGARLFVFSDGAYEIKRPDDTMMELEDFVKILAEPTQSESKVGEILDLVRQQHGSDDLADDFSLIEATFA